ILYCDVLIYVLIVFFFQAEDGIRDRNVTGVQTCALPISYLKRTFARDARLCVRVAHFVEMGPQQIETRGKGKFPAALAALDDVRSEERRVGKEGIYQE